MIWGRSKYLLVATSFLVLADTSLYFPFSLFYCLTVRILVWGYFSMSQGLFAPQMRFYPVYAWSVFAINIVITVITGKSR